jgi:DNA helicase-2/ATP-dependent DNA helicase PcrA
MSPRPSRFLKEIPAENTEEVRARTSSVSDNFTTMAPKHSKSLNETGFKPGQTVEHPKFGTGLVIDFEGAGKGARVQVNFDQVGSKWLVLAYANLTVV